MTAELASRIRAEVVDALGPDEPGPDAATVREAARRADPLLAESALDLVVADVLSETNGLGRVDALLGRDDVTEVMVNPGSVWVERSGVLEQTDLVLTADQVEHLIERIVGPLGRRVDRSSPLVDARLPDGSRVHAVVPPLAVDGPCVTIRRFRARPVPLADFASADVVGLLRSAVDDRRNLLVSGGTGAGKTTLLNALAARLPDGERLVTIEDVAELRLGHGHVVRLESRAETADGVGRVTIRDLVRNALRMRPDRLVVGEVRGAEALDMLQAMNTGHEGSLSTCHANSALDALRRVESMILMGDAAVASGPVRELIRSSLDLVVHVARVAGGGRRVVEVAEVLDDPLGGGLDVRRLAGPAGVVAGSARPRGCS